MTRLKSILIAVLSTGWLVPLFCSVLAYLDFSRAELERHVWGQTVVVGFDRVQFAQAMSVIAFAWLTIAVVSWVYYVCRRLKRQT
jgi:hypothetical protein